MFNIKIYFWLYSGNYISNMQTYRNALHFFFGTHEVIPMADTVLSLPVWLLVHLPSEPEAGCTWFMAWVFHLSSLLQGWEGEDLSPGYLYFFAVCRACSSGSRAEGLHLLELGRELKPIFVRKMDTSTAPGSFA